MNYGKLTVVCVLGLLGVTSCMQPERIVRRQIQFDNNAPGEVRIMTFNIRRGTADDGANHWSRRKELVFDTLAYHGADVIGLQEAVDFQIYEIKRALGQYKVIWTGRDDGRQAGEACPIFYRRDRFTLTNSGTFWFSNMPWKPGSMHWGNTYTRICTWARLNETATGNNFYVYNLHLDHASQSSREHSVQLLLKELVNRKHPDSAVVMGDFNMEIDNPAMAPLQRIGAKLVNEPMVDVWGYLHPEQPSVTTYQAFGANPDGPCLDHIFVEETTEIIEAAIDTRSFDGRYPSDHFPVIATVRIKSNIKGTSKNSFWRLSESF